MCFWGSVVGGVAPVGYGALLCRPAELVCALVRAGGGSFPPAVQVWRARASRLLALSLGQGLLGTRGWSINCDVQTSLALHFPPFPPSQVDRWAWAWA